MKKETDKTHDIDNTMTVFNKFFAHWLKEVNIKRYPDDICILPTNNTVDIYNYSAKMLKTLPAKALDTIKETLLYEKKPVVIPNNTGRRSNTSATPADRTEANLGTRITDFNPIIKTKNYYRIPVKYFVYLRLVNFTEKTNTKFIFTFETNLNKLFESNAKEVISRSPDAEIIFYDIPHISYRQITLDDNFQSYLNATFRAKKATRTTVQFSSYQQSFEINVGMQSINVGFIGADRQFNWLEISLLYDKNDQHQTVYDRYDAELAAKKMQSIKIEKNSATYSLTGGLTYDIDDENDKHWLYEMFVSY